MRNNYNNRKILYIVIVVLLVFIATLTVAYSALSVILKVSGTAQVQQANWEIRFANIEVKAGSVNATKKAIISNYNQVDFEVVLNKPGDYYEFNVDIINSGSIDAMIDTIVKTPNLTPEQQKYIIYEITYSDGNNIGLKQLLKAKKQKTIKVRVAYKTDLTINDLPKTPDNLNLSFQAIITQADSSNIVGPEGSGETNQKLIRVLKGTGKNLGDEIAIKDEEFYVLGAGSPTETVILAKNLLKVGGKYLYNEEKYIPYTKEEATGLQDKEARGAQQARNIWHGITPFATKEVHGQQMNSYEGSLAQKYVNEYKLKLESFGAKINVATLMNSNILEINLGCNVLEEGMPTCKKSPYKWVYEVSYWTNTASSSGTVRIVDDGGFFTSAPPDMIGFFGIRPLLVIDQDLIK